MTTQLPTKTYIDFLNAAQIAMINNNATEKVGVPIFYTINDLVSLFASAANDHGQDIVSTPVDPRTAPMDKNVRKMFLRLGPMHTTTHVYDDGLTVGFSILGYASTLGRDILCMASEVDGQNNIVNRGPKFRAPLSKQLFDEFRFNPREGAKTFFASLTLKLGQPDRAMAMCFVSPNPSRN